MAITLDLCEALSGLTYDEWQAVKDVVDNSIATSAMKWLEAAKAEHLESHGPVRCELAGPQILAKAESLIAAD